MGMTGTNCKVALVGAGYMAREHARAFADVPGVTVAGIHGRTRARAEALATEFGISVVSDSVAELFERTRADLVVVAVGELSLNDVARACFDHPWTVLLEKPAGYDLADAEDIHSARSENVFVALNRRFYSSTRAALTGMAADDGLRFIKVQDQEEPARALAAGRPKQVVDNWMYANSIHIIDYFRLFGRGRITRVEPVVPWDAGNPSIVVARLDYSSGDIGLYEGIWNAPGPWAVNTTTRQTRWELRPLEELSVQRSGERKLTPMLPDESDTRFKPGLRLQAEHAVAAALGEPNDSVSLSDALESTRLVARIFGLHPHGSS